MRARFNCVSANAHIHSLFRCYGLKASLLRIKVIEMLFETVSCKNTLSAGEVSEPLKAPGISLLSIREMFKRLQDVGMVTVHEDKNYSLSQEAIRTLQELNAEGQPGTDGS
ncbi:hypothetical protein F3J44_09140 [Pantoea sp. Tr-811]|uniref:hypothetical protein n=1 Tax=Pantoea sp. Tr-811 TaxID=2608361 RepID=UPI0014209CC5|nr:hypothetical protein [Pantoea sp. Tr-811]NIF26554.1 hypothetical protein [Pantoea sp. Tr-811]